jgi:hypothetical protein
MLKVLLFVIALSPVMSSGTAWGMERQVNAEPGAETETAKQPDGSQNPEDPKDPPASKDPETKPMGLLEQIERFGLRIDDDWEISERVPDETMAVIVNPFSVRKRGSIYGSVYLFHRNNNFDARNFFDPPDSGRPEYRRNQFGLSLGVHTGGSLRVFGSYEGLRILRGSTLVSLVPTPAMKRGDFSALATPIVDPFTGDPFPNNLIPESRIHPVSSRLLSLFPDPNRIDDPRRNFINNQPIVNDSDSFSTRVDYEFSTRTRISANHNYSGGEQVRVSPLPAFESISDDTSHDFSTDLTHSFRPNRVFNFNVRYRRNLNTQLSRHAFQSGLLESLGIQGVGVLDDMDEGYPQFDLMGYANLGFSGMTNSPENWTENSYRIQSQYTHVRGNHNIRLGGNMIYTQYNNMRTWGTRRGQFGFSGRFTGDAFADFLLGIPYVATRGIAGDDINNPQVGSNRLDLRNRSWSLFIRDDWRINQNFSVSLGLTYNFSPHFTSADDNVSLFYPMVFEPPVDGEVVVTGSSRARELGLDLKPGQAAYNDRNDWQPSVGFAYSPMGNNRLVLRSSYAITHGSMNTFQALTYVGRNFPFFYLQRADSPTMPDIDLSRPFTSAALPALTFQAVDPYLRNPYTQRWNLRLQYEFLPSWNLTLTYAGSKTTRLHRVTPANVPLPGRFDEPIQPRRPNPDYGGFEILQSNASSSGNEMDVEIMRRMTDFFSVQTRFNWNRSISDGGGWAFANINDPRNLAAERALSSSPTKSFSMNYILDLPVGPDKLLSTRWAGRFGRVLEGWRMSGITSIQGGRAFHPTIFGDPNNDGVWGDRPNRIGSGVLPKSERSINKWFETSHFVLPDYHGPEPEWFGNSGRNILYGPGSTRWDISLIKNTTITRGQALEFRVQLFNAFNHVNFNQPGSVLNSPTFGVISGADNAREIEIAIKYSF